MTVRSRRTQFIHIINVKGKQYQFVGASGSLAMGINYKKQKNKNKKHTNFTLIVLLYLVVSLLAASQAVVAVEGGALMQLNLRYSLRMLWQKSKSHPLDPLPRSRVFDF